MAPIMGHPCRKAVGVLVTLQAGEAHLFIEYRSRTQCVDRDNTHIAGPKVSVTVGNDYSNSNIMGVPSECFLDAYVDVFVSGDIMSETHMRTF